MTASPASANNATLTGALDLARRGYRVFPVGLDKTPLIKNGHNGATTDKEHIYKWWGKEGCGVAVATGNGFMVIDLDVKKGKNGITSLAKLEAANRALPRTPRVCTPTRGQHLWLKVDQKIQCSVGRVGHGIDIRGDGGYVVVPPTHVDHTDKTGAHIVGDYTWITSLDECDIPPAPQWLIDKALNKSTASLGTSDDEIADLINDAVTVEGTWHDNIRDVVAKLIAKGTPASAILTMADHLTLSGYTVEDTRDQLQVFIDGAVKKGWGPPIGEQSEQDDDNPAFINIRSGKLPEMVDAAEAALLRTHGERGIYQRGGMLVRPALVPVRASDDQEVIAQCLVPVDKIYLVELLTKAIGWKTYDGRAKAMRPKDCPDSVAQTLLARVGEWRLPVLTGICAAPTLRRDGSVLETEGYDPATGLLLDFRGVEFPPVPQQPTFEDALAALDVLKNAVKTFPFVSGADLSVWLSSALTLLVRRSLQTAPLHGFTAPAARSGKSKLVDGASIMALGHKAPVIAQGAKDEELEKRLDGCLVEGDLLIALDNCERALGGDKICQMLTQEVVKVRILGKTGNRETLSVAMITATANNLLLTGDVVHRSVLCRIDAKVERPEERVFEENFEETIAQNRTQLVVAALTMLRAYHVAGRPKQTIPLGGFEQWSRLVRDALVWVRCADPVSTQQQLRDNDPQRARLFTVMELWGAMFGEDRVTAKEAVRAVAHTDTWDPNETEEQKAARETRRQLRQDFESALMEIAGEGKTISTRRLGTWLGRNKEALVNGRRFEQDGITMGDTLWVLRKV